MIYVLYINKTVFAATSYEAHAEELVEKGFYDYYIAVKMVYPEWR